MDAACKRNKSKQWNYFFFFYCFVMNSSPDLMKAADDSCVITVMLRGKGRQIWSVGCSYRVKG